MKYVKKLKQAWALIMVLAVIITSIPLSSMAENTAAGDRNTGTVEMIIRGDTFQGKNFNVFGHMHHSITMYHVNPVEGHVPSFCLQPGKKLPNHTIMNYTRYDLNQGESVPYIGSWERFLHINLAYEWAVSGNYYEPARYAVVQTYIWGCIAGYEDNWAVQDGVQQQLAGIMGARASQLYGEMKAYVRAEAEGFNGTGGGALPAWNGTQQRMELKDGGYELTLDISTCPQLRETMWTFPGSGWSYAVSTDGKSITFQYRGTGIPNGTITSAELNGISNRFYLYLLQPQDSNLQVQVGWINLEKTPANVYFSVGDYQPTGEGGGELELYRHSETFESNYNIDLEKYCAETNQRLEGAAFYVWEDFDFSQVNEGGYTEGEPDGTTGQVYLNRMSPEPESNYICDTITTDENGYASHSDVRSYNYSKTYCMGHPAPEWVECDHEADEECSCEEENDRLREQWQAEQELCASTCDFHVSNEDEDNHEQDTAAMEAMLADRDETYENFINLEYSYTLEEIHARNGYTLHGKHNDDQPIETVVLSSAQAEGGVMAGSFHQESTVSDRPVIYTYPTGSQKMEGRRAYQYQVPEAADLSLEEMRSIVELQEEKEKETKPEAAPEGAAGQSSGTADGSPAKDGGEEGTVETEDTGGEEDSKDGGEGNSGSAGGENAGNESGNETAGEENTGSEGGSGSAGGENAGSEGGSESAGGENAGSEDDSGASGEENGSRESGGEPAGEESTGGGDSVSAEEDAGPGGAEIEDTREKGSSAAQREVQADTTEASSAASISSRFHGRMQLLSKAPDISGEQTEEKKQREPDISREKEETGNQEQASIKTASSSETIWEEDDPFEDTETYSYEYTRFPIEQDNSRSIEYIHLEEEKETEGGGTGQQGLFARAARAIISFFSDDDEEEDSITATLPPFIDDDLDPMDTSAYGDPDTILYTFKVWDHRTEGRIHMNKRDLELYKKDEKSSYGRTQGDATLEGAVYGLFAAQDIIHPDGKSGVVYNQNDLVAVAATDKEGNASFLAFTEKPGTRLDGSGNIAPPAGSTGPENLYDGSSVTSSSEGFGTITYPDYENDNGSRWIGRPLLLGNYYIMEISRSEGYELSVSGSNLTETNRTMDGIATIRQSGQVSVVRGLSDNTHMEADGSWNDFTIERYRTEQGYDITVKGYPEGTVFYRVDLEEKTETVKSVIGGSWQEKTENGGTLYQTAKGGEYKLGPDGNPVLKLPDASGSEPEERIPYAETLSYRFRTAPRPNGTAAPKDLSKWNQSIQPTYLKDQVNEMLSQIGYRQAKAVQGAPWADIPLTGAANGQAAGEILDWFTEHSFFDCGSVESVYEKDGAWYARVCYDCTSGNDSCPAVYDAASKTLYVRKEAEVTGGPADRIHYWIAYEKGSYRLNSRTASVAEKRAATKEIPYGEDISSYLQILYQPVYETYAPGEILRDTGGNPIPVMEYVPIYEDVEVTYQDEVLTQVKAAYDKDTGIYTIHVDNSTDWEAETEAIRDMYRAVTDQSAIEYEGQEMRYDQYLVRVAGAAVDAVAAIPPLNEGSYIKTQQLTYPGQNEPQQDGGTDKKPVQLLQRVIKQSIKVTKDISQSSYDKVNTYGSVHNDPLTTLLGLFGKGPSIQGAKLLNQFKFKLYLKSNLENIYVDEEGKLLSEDIGNDDGKADAELIFLPPKKGGGRRLLETKADGSYHYQKFFDAMYAADQKAGNTYPAQVLEQFALDYYDIAAYKEEILEAEPELNSDAAYEKALNLAKEEASAYLDMFVGLDRRLAIAWDKDDGGGADRDKTTLECNTKNGKDDYYDHSIMLPYGTYVIAEQTAADVRNELANRHYERDYPKEITLPFVPHIITDSNTGEEEANYEAGDPYFRYSSSDTPEDLIRKYKIRFNEETHIIKAHSHDGDFEVFKYGLDKDIRPGHSMTSKPPYDAEYMDGANGTVKAYYRGYTSQSEDKGTRDGVVYDGNETDSGQLEIRDAVPTMKGMQTAIEGKFASMLVPWTVLAPAVDRKNPDTGDIETLSPFGSGENFNYAAFAQEDFENRYYSSRLRIEKLDAETGDNIIHDGAIFKIYAAKRDVEKAGVNTANGTGAVLFGEAVDIHGKTVADADGKPILYPRVGESNISENDLPIHLDEEGIPQYDESQLIRQQDETGNEVGIFRAYSTIRELVIDGQVQKEKTGYIETYKPLGAGAYVLVELEAPEGYTKSRPVAFEIYSDDITYYADDRHIDGTTDGWKEETAAKYQYAIPVSGGTDKYETETTGQVLVQDHPSRMEIHKVEDGDSLVGNQNSLQKTDAQGEKEKSGGFDRELAVNDKGDLFIYEVRGRREKLQERGDVRDIAYDPEAQEWYGYVTKAFDEYSEKFVEGTEKELKAMKGVKPLYELDGTFTGKGIRFDITISEASLALYHGIELEPAGEHAYKGVEAVWENGKVARIQNTNTGTHREIREAGEDSGPARLREWDAVEVENEPVELYFYDLTELETVASLPYRLEEYGKKELALYREPDTGELFVLDSRGNRICYADSLTGMAYVYDDYGRIIAYTADENGQKQLVQSIQIMEDGGTRTIYKDKQTVDDENGLPIYYTDGRLVTKEERWETDASTDPYGNPETEAATHTITRLPFGAYILEEERVPYGQGYIQAEYMGLILEDTEEIQKYFLQDEFTKTAFAKIDVMTQKEIRDAHMTLYRALTDNEGRPLREEDGTYRKGESYAAWISGYEYDDDGNMKYDGGGNPIPTTKPHWIDHIPVGAYVLEETICPYEQGYVLSEAVNVDVLETGHVQSFQMEDDFTALDIRKYDTKNEDVIYKDSEAYLTLYHAKLDGEGQPELTDGMPSYEETERIFTFRAATYKDGQEVAATGRIVTDAAGNHPIIKYDYDFQTIPNTCQGRWYYTENAAVRLEYLPVGHYVLVETGNPKGYATAGPVLITVEDTGHLEKIQYTQMGDKPLSLEISKVNITGGKEVNGATLTIYPVNEDGTVSDEPLILHQPTENGEYQDITATWTSGLDGRYTQEDREAGMIPEGFEEGDQKPHVVEYIPEGSYILREETAPYGFLQSVDVPFAIIDTQLVQTAEMIDEIPDGILKITKTDADHPEETLSGADFQLENKTLGIHCQTVTTDEKGEAHFNPQPIGYMDQDGNFKPYTYLCTETKAAEGHMLTLKPYEFQFEYIDEKTALIPLEYYPANDSNRVVSEKLLGDTAEYLEGVTLRIERKQDAGSSWETVDEWISGKQGHYTKDLKAGSYRLVEVEAAEGFQMLAQPIEFTITDGMKEIPRLTMRNYSTIVEIPKVSSSGSLLAGARLQLIRKDTGRIVREWTSEAEKGQTFYGLEAGAYIIHELESPSGYKKSSDKEITVQETDTSIQVFRYENSLKSSGGGGGGGTTPVPEYIVFKKADHAGNAVEGAEFTFYDQEGTIIGTSVSDAQGRFRIKKPRDGTYTFRETKAPEGYRGNTDIYSFTVKGSGIIRGTYEVVNEEIPKPVYKKDGITKEPLPGAVLSIEWKEDGALCTFEGITGEDGCLDFKPPCPGTYRIRERKPPEGYLHSQDIYEFYVDEDGQINGNTVVYNFRQLKKIGRITASYQIKDRFGRGSFRFGKRERIRTGDDFPLYQTIFTAIAGLAGAGICLYAEKKKGGKGKNENRP
ncbi:SpaA isopeptide-forming pilin-related protein [Lacrimispora sp. 210928-DFI.3.58]|uniref:SpaA isopeptide-forming pilin-related protein n=1 Tax=Lacrimispora sp. 210928-DFI.3.58 TaxID=2883214 RepID=UPI0029CAA8AE|nr:SpaA isopeptide-forming pilin-related protein [Lacrimispora sp. 210928-DFI.3.58]